MIARVAALLKWLFVVPQDAVYLIERFDADGKSIDRTHHEWGDDLNEVLRALKGSQTNYAMTAVTPSFRLRASTLSVLTCCALVWGTCRTFVVEVNDKQLEFLDATAFEERTPLQITLRRPGLVRYEVRDEEVHRHGPLRAGRPHGTWRVWQERVPSSRPISTSAYINVDYDFGYYVASSKNPMRLGYLRGPAPQPLTLDQVDGYQPRLKARDIHGHWRFDWIAQYASTPEFQR